MDNESKPRRSPMEILIEAPRNNKIEKAPGCTNNRGLYLRRHFVGE